MRFGCTSSSLVLLEILLTGILLRHACSALHRAGGSTQKTGPSMLSYSDRQRYAIMDAAYDRTQLSIHNAPGLGVCNTTTCFSPAIDYIKPGPSIRAYMTPMGAVYGQVDSCLDQFSALYPTQSGHGAQHCCMPQHIICMFEGGWCW